MCHKFKSLLFLLLIFCLNAKKAVVNYIIKNANDLFDMQQLMKSVIQVKITFIDAKKREKKLL